VKDFPPTIPEAVLVLTNAIQQAAPSARLILVGGSAFELHFPGAHASTDADLILHAVDAGPLAAIQIFESAATSLGFVRSGRVFRHPKSWYTLDYVGKDVSIGSLNMISEVVSYPVAQSHIEVLSPTAMLFDRLVAWDAWADESSLLHAELASKTGSKVIDIAALERFLRTEGIFQKLKREIDLKGHTALSKLLLTKDPR
jgi:hypothetical protein